MRKRDRAVMILLSIALQQYSRDAVLLDERFEELRATYPGQYAGVLGGQIKIAPSLKEVLAKLGSFANWAAVRKLEHIKSLRQSAA